MSCKEALRVLLDQVDYTAGACRLVEMVGAVLPKEVIVLARAAIEAEENSPKSSKVANDSASDNTTKDKIKPCSNKECRNYHAGEYDDTNCLSYHLDELEDRCPDYRT